MKLQIFFTSTAKSKIIFYEICQIQHYTQLGKNETCFAQGRIVNLHMPVLKQELTNNQFIALKIAVPKNPISFNKLRHALL